MSHNEMKTICDALAWALRRIKTSRLGEGDYFAKAEAILDGALAVPGEVSEVDRLDAIRYRWLRDNHAQSFGMTIDTPAEHTLVFLWQQGSPEQASWTLDDAIDAARAAPPVPCGSGVDEV
jgi:hypothetical protein